MDGSKHGGRIDARARTTLLRRVAAAVAATAVCGEAQAGDSVTEPRPVPSLLWLTTQLVPSPEIGAGRGGSHFGLGWQITPALYSWGIHRKLSGWRAFVVEPNVRHSGSLELHVSPDVFFGATQVLGARTGLRTYVPIVERGEWMSASLGMIHQYAGGESRVGGELGVYMLFGILGAQISHVPGPAVPLQTIATLRLRYF